MLLAEETSRVEIERILQSETFRSSDVLRRLFRFLAEKAVAGEADQLKEYSIGLDAFGKPSTYDPRNDAIVRLQAGRLRQKLAEYYRTEGKDDPVVIDLPKGHFKLTREPRPRIPEAYRPRRQQWQRVALFLGVALLVTLVWAVRVSLALRNLRETSVSSAMWTPELKQLWGPFIGTNHPRVVAFDDPLFVGFVGRDGNVVAHLRVSGVSRFEEISNTPAVIAVQLGVGKPCCWPEIQLCSARRCGLLFSIGKAARFRRVATLCCEIEPGVMAELIREQRSAHWPTKVSG
jgi:hypothetical protein